MEQIFVQPRVSLKRAQSEILDYSLKIFSPSPVRNTSKISLNIARELFDLHSLIEEQEHHSHNPQTSSFYKTRFISLRKESDSSNSWGSDSSHSGSFHIEQESPAKTTTSHNYLIIDSIEEMTPDVVPRASNPIVKDVNFKRCNQDGIKFNHGSVITSRS